MLEAQDLMVFYENMLALNNVSVRCEENQIVGVFGANSAGKSTLMKVLSGIYQDYEGSTMCSASREFVCCPDIRLP